MSSLALLYILDYTYSIRPKIKTLEKWNVVKMSIRRGGRGERGTKERGKMFQKRTSVWNR